MTMFSVLSVASQTTASPHHPFIRVTMTSDSVTKTVKSHVIHERIAQVDGKRKPEDLRELHLDGCKADNLSTAKLLLERHLNLHELSLVNLGLSSVREFPKLPHLRVLDLADNRISTGFEILVENAPNLEKLMLGGNRVKSFDVIKSLKPLSKLKFLDLFDNEVTSGDGYREKVFDLLPQLTDLDGRDKDDRESRESDDDDDAGGEDYESESDENDAETGENGDQVEDDEMNGEENVLENGSGDETGASNGLKSKLSGKEGKGVKRKGDDDTGVE